VSDITALSGSGGQRDRHVAEGDAVVFDVPPVDCYPAPSVEWVDASGAVLARTADRHHVTRTDQLVILDVRHERDHNAVFRATATNRFTLQTSASPLYVLRVQREYIRPSHPPPHNSPLTTLLNINLHNFAVNNFSAFSKGPRRKGHRRLSSHDTHLFVNTGRYSCLLPA